MWYKQQTASLKFPTFPQMFSLCGFSLRPSPRKTWTEVGQMTKSSTRICASRMVNFQVERHLTFVSQGFCGFETPIQVTKNWISDSHHGKCGSMLNMLLKCVFFVEEKCAGRTNHWTSCSRKLAVASFTLRSMFFLEKKPCFRVVQGDCSNGVQQGIETSDMMNMMSFTPKRHHF